MRIVIFFTTLSVFGQNLSIGVIGGFSPTEDFQNHRSFSDGLGSTEYSTSKHYAFGATLEYHFARRFSLEADGIYHPLGFTFAGIEPNGSLNSISPATVITWEFPVLVKYKLAFSGLHPFVEAGPSFRTTGNLNDQNPSHFGVTAGVGVETRLCGLAIAPAIRYTHWNPDDHHGTVNDQVEVLVGFSSAARSRWAPMGSRISLGGIAGLNLLGDYRPQSYFYSSDLLQETDLQSSGPRSFQAGAIIEVKLAGQFSVEADLIHESVKGRNQRSGFQQLPQGTFPLNTNFVFSESEWKFPVLAKYRFHRERWTPLAELGPTFRIPPGATSLSAYGATAGLGVETHWRRLKIAPVVRYTRWAPETSFQYTRGSRNQLDLLTGFSF
jgi:hypothetical protein